jgi:hypothetical protein
MASSNQATSSSRRPEPTPSHDGEQLRRRLRLNWNENQVRILQECLNLLIVLDREFSRRQALLLSLTFLLLFERLLFDQFFVLLSLAPASLGITTRLDESYHSEKVVPEAHEE